MFPIPDNRGFCFKIPYLNRMLYLYSQPIARFQAYFLRIFRNPSLDCLRARGLRRRLVFRFE